MTTKVYIINEGPKNIVITENGVNLKYVKPMELHSTLVYKDHAIVVAEVPDPEININE